MCLSQESFTTGQCNCTQSVVKVFEDKLVITRSEYEEYVQLKFLRDTLDKLSRSKKYFDSAEIRTALGLDAVEEEKHGMEV